MIDPKNNYTKMQKNFYGEKKANEMASVDHRHHNANPDYWDVLLEPITSDPTHWNRLKALDFGCGTGRNIKNLLGLSAWERVDGVDISGFNLRNADDLLRMDGLKNFKLYKNNGIDLDVLPKNEYDFIMSTIVLQHIAVYDIRFSLLKGMFDALKSGGVLSFQMGFGDNGHGKADYHANDYDAKGTNSKHDVIVTDPKQISDDLEKIGFTQWFYTTKNPFSDGHQQWIFFKAIKP